MKAVRRKAASLERELDQMKFSMEASSRESNELLVGLRSQISHLEAENAGLNGRFQKNILESKKKLDVERAEHRNTKDKLRVILENEERMSIEIENLNKKVKFFKANTYSRSSNCEAKNSQRMSLIETSSIKKSLKYLFEKVRSFKIQHNKEKIQLLEEIKFYQTSICNTTDTLVIRIKEEAKRNKYQSKDIERLRGDLQKLQKINEEFSVKLVSHKSLSKMTTVELASNGGFESMDDRENRRPEKKEGMMERFSVTDRKYGFQDSKRNTIGGLRLSSLHSSHSLPFHSSFMRGSSGLKGYNTVQRESLTFQEKLSSLKNNEHNFTNNHQSRDFPKQGESLVPKLNFKENNENINLPREYMSSYSSVRLLSQRIENKGNSGILAERNNTSSNNWRESLANKERQNYYENRDFSKERGPMNCTNNERIENRNTKFGILREISEVNSLKNRGGN